MLKRLIVILVIVFCIVFNSLNINIDNNKQEFINVTILGEVNKPGTYSLKLGSTLNDLFNLSIINENADIRTFNKDKILSNNERIHIPKSNKETISINNASYQELLQLPGIGEVIANRIIEYRNRYGSFLFLDELLYISGIGEKKYEQIKKHICL